MATCHVPVVRFNQAEWRFPGIGFVLGALVIWGSLGRRTILVPKGTSLVQVSRFGGGPREIYVSRWDSASRGPRIRDLPARRQQDHEACMWGVPDREHRSRLPLTLQRGVGEGEEDVHEAARSAATYYRDQQRTNEFGGFRPPRLRAALPP